MLGSLLRRLTGQRSEPVRAPVSPPPSLVEEEARADLPVPAEAAVESDLAVSGLEASIPAGGLGKSPVFSSRAVRDATVVTGTIESLTRFVDEQDVLDDLTWRLENLTPDQVNFLQLSAEPGLIQRALARSEVLKGAKAAALRKLLTDLASGAIPEPVNRANPLSLPKGPILPPLTSLQPRSATAPADLAALPPTLGPANPVPPGPGMPSLTTAPPLATRPIPPVPAKPVSPPPAPPSSAPLSAPPVARVTPPPAARPEPAVAKAPESRPVAPRLPELPPAAEKPSAPATVPDAPSPEPARSEPVTKPAATVVDTIVKGVAAAPKISDPVAAPKPPAPAPAPAATPKAAEPAPAPEPPKAAAPPRPVPAAIPVAAPVPEPAPPAATPSVPRLGRHDAEARRARLLASLNDTLSSSEAAP
ncbi:MAG: hypothetical protein ACOVN0_10895 [Niveispirillum sp.]|uniref:hypothetical protein n=1 Tax=Niveispirillum sp. TaxID=1917217 RepID=UPI003BA7B088